MGIFTKKAKDEVKQAEIFETKSQGTISSERVYTPIERPTPREAQTSVYDILTEVEGYKAVDRNMKAFFGHMTYEVGKTCVLSGPVVPCENGFHFCMTLEDTLELFPPIEGRRYFKVRAVVPARKTVKDGYEDLVIKDCGSIMYDRDMAEYKKKQMLDSSYFSMPPFASCYDNYKKKYVAKEITLIEEVPFADFAKEACTSFIHNEEDYRTLVTNEDVKARAIKLWLEKTNGYFSEGFSIYVFEKKIETRSENHNYREFLLNAFDDLSEILEGIKNENISQDMKTLYMLRLSGILN